jgi:subtilisin-like proprotein convertase family protein
MKRNHKLSAAKMLLLLAAAATLVMFIWDFTPRASMKGKGKGQEELPATTRVSAAAKYRSPGNFHKVIVSDRDLAKSIESQGGRLVADYGSFKLLEVNETLANSLGEKQGAELSDESNLIMLNAGAFDTTTAEVQRLRQPVGGFGGKRMHLVQFAGPIRPEWHSALLKTGVEIVTYIPSNAYLIYGTSSSIQRAQALSAFVQWDGEYTETMRVSPSILRALDRKSTESTEKKGSKTGAAEKAKAALEKDQDLYAIQLVKDRSANTDTLALIESLRTRKITNQWEVLNYLDVVVHISAAAVVAQIAKRPDVVSIHPYITPEKFDERQNFILAGQISGSPAVPTPGNWLLYLASKGFTQAQFTTSNFAVNISDSGLDDGTQAPNHFALYTTGDPNNPSRVIYNRLEGTPNAGSTITGLDGHGTLNSHIIMGYVPTGGIFAAAPHADASGFRYGIGVNPFVKIGSSVIFDPGTYTNPNQINLESRAYADGARISSNSWGANSNTYTVDSQNYDTVVRDAQSATSVNPVAGNQEMVVIFAAGNAGSGAGSVGQPGTAKNVITAGASENVQAFGGSDGCGVGDGGADNANDIINFSGRGPTSDGRKKPELVAPGTHITGGAWQTALVNPVSGNGASPFDGTGVCGGVGGSNFFPAGQQWYAASSGTSHSTPAIAGAAALVRQFFINQLGGPPSAAMTKAVMMNSARYMTGVGANDTLWSNSQGMGEVNLDSFFDIFATTHVFKDQLGPDRFTASGQQRIVAGTIGTGAKPFRVTLAWTDVPGPTSGNAYVNNLDLEVTVGGNTYKGNVFSGQNSATGGTADIRNNVESVLVPAGVTGNFIVRVIGTNIAGDGVPNDGWPLDQDYALVVFNGSEAPVPVISSGSKAVTAESCAPSNNAIDPGETVTVDLGLANVGTGNTSNLVATLQATGGVSAPSGPQNYGALTAGGAEVVRSFSFTSGASCGQIITATLQLQDGAADLGTVTFTFQVGTVGSGSTVSYTTGNIATPIPDLSFVEIPIVVSQQGAVGDMNVKVRLNHTFDRDLSLELISPDGTTVSLADRRDTASGGGDNYGTGANDCSGSPTTFDDAAATPISAGVPPFSGSFRPEVPLAAFNGKSLSGTWKLKVTDNEGQDVGTVGCVTLEVLRQPYVCCGVAGNPDIDASGPATITAESIAPANNVPDPGETVTATFPVVNVGDGPTTAGLVGTLQTSGGVTPVGNPNRTYGVITPGSPPVSQPYTFSVAGACGGTVIATLHFQDGIVDLGTVTFQLTLGTSTNSTQTFSNSTAIVIPASGTGATTGSPATPYPSNITVAGFTGSVSKVTVTLKNISHTFPSDVDVLLVGPTGVKFVLMSDVIGGTDWTGQTYTIDDAATALFPASGSPPASGTFQPTNYGTGDLFPAPAPAAPYLDPATAGSATLASAFNGLNPNGIWSLYVVDDAGTDIGSFAGGWELTLTSSGAVCNTQACSITCPTNITVPADGGGTSAVVNYPNPAVTGACQTISASPASGSTFPVGTTTVNVTTGAGPACSFTVTVTGATPPLASTTLAIGEFRLRGALGALDEYIEIVNVSGAPFTVNASDASAGWSVAALNAAGTVASIVATIPNGTMIPARGHYLIANNTASVGYSLSNYGGAGNATPNATYTADIADNTGVALFNTANVANLSAATRIDTVNFTSQNGAQSPLFTEGTRLAPIAGDGEYAFVRKLTTGLPKDTGDNAADFEFVSTTAGTFGVLSVRGAPGPENLASPIQRNATVKAGLIDPTQSSSAPPNRVRDTTPGTGATALGTLDIRRKFTNNTGAIITRLRFRAVDITTTNTPGGPLADVRILTSVDTTANGGTITIRGTALEGPSDAVTGGGSNSSVVVAIPGGFLAPGASVNVRYLLGVAQGGTFRFFVNVEALP